MSLEYLPKLLKCSVCGKPCELGCRCVAEIILGYVAVEAERALAKAGAVDVDANGSHVEDA